MQLRFIKSGRLCCSIFHNTEKTPHNKDTLTKILISAKDEVLSLGYELPVSA